ncbi:MAG: 2-hydroxyacyl-CoA dehydratase, partial [Bacteroidales bacterium]
LVESLKIKAITSKNIEPFVSTKAFGKTEKNRTILVPYFTDYLSPLLPSLLTLAGYQIEVLPPSDAKSVEMGLKYANNEVCYPATLIVGDIMKALFSGKYDRSKIAVIITQTGGQCRASNYIALIKSALVSADFADIPVISLSMGSGLNVNQKGFKINWLKILPITLSAILFGDCISKFYHATVVRERKKGEAALLRTSFLQQAQSFILQNDSPALLNLLAHAAQQFNELAEDKHTKKVGIVGEIFLKFNSFAHKNVVDWLIAQDIEVVPPVLISFFLQSFPNTKARLEHNLQKSDISSLLMDTLYKMIRKKIEEVNQLASTFRFFIPFTDIYQEAQNGSKVISLAAQFGEGWLLPAEIVSFAKADVNNVISLQPFGCIANQVVVKGVENKIKQLYPNMNLLSLDFDSGVSDANIINRLHLMIDDLN